MLAITPAILKKQMKDKIINITKSIEDFFLRYFLVKNVNMNDPINVIPNNNAASYHFI